MPVIRQLLIGSRERTSDLRARACTASAAAPSAGSGDAVAFPSFSSRTMVLKGMLGAPQLPRFYKDLCDPRFASALAIVHSRFSTNTFPSWALAHPFRFIAHNGEINTLRGNVNWMRAREHALGEFAEVRPVIPAGRVGLRVASTPCSSCSCSPGRPLAHAVMMMVPGGVGGPRRPARAPARVLRLPREAHGAVGRARPRSRSPTGAMLGAKLDRNGLRPGRWAQTDDGWVVLASETGALPLEPARVVKRGRLKPGALWIVDLDRGALFADREVECEIASRRPYGTWAAEATIRLRGRRARRAAAGARGAARRAADRLRLHARGPRHPDRPDGRDGQGADRLDGRRRRAAGALATRRRRCSPTSSSASRRSPTRRSTRCARTW